MSPLQSMIWKSTEDRLEEPCYLSRFEKVREVRVRKQRTHVGKYSL